MAARHVFLKKKFQKFRGKGGELEQNLTTGKLLSGEKQKVTFKKVGKKVKRINGKPD